MKFHIYFVYIIECSDNTYYVGVTSNLELRLEIHNSGCDPTCYTARRLPLKLRYFKIFNYIDQAIKFEKQLKG
jgi:putative endonuclease